MGKAGAARVKAYDAAYGAAMQNHEERNDLAGSKRSIRDVQPFVYSPYVGPDAPNPFSETEKPKSNDMNVRIKRILAQIEEKPKGRNFTIMDACNAHVEGARKNKNAKKEFLHGFMQCPTDIQITEKSQRLMLSVAVDFVNQVYGGNAVFHARIDRDEKGKHGVDVFFAPRYQKHTASLGTEQWISLSKFSKENARERYKKRQKQQKNKKTKKFEPVFDEDGMPVMVWNDADYFQGMALQDAWFEHLKEHFGDRYEIERGSRKKGRDPDRLSPEDFAVAEEQKKLRNEMQLQLESIHIDIDEEDFHQRSAAHLIEKGRADALAEARKKARDSANREAASIVTQAKAEAKAQAEIYLSSDAKEFTAMKQENERLRAETRRQSGIIRLLVKAIETFVPVGFLLKLRRKFNADWAEESPQEEPFNWGKEPKVEMEKSHSSSLGL